MKDSLTQPLEQLPLLVAQAADAAPFRIAILVRLVLTVWILVKTLKVAKRDNISKPCLYGLATAVAAALLLDILQSMPLPTMEVPRALLLLTGGGLIFGGFAAAMGLAGYGLVTYRRPREEPYAQGAAQGALALLISFGFCAVTGYALADYSSTQQAEIATSEGGIEGDSASDPSLAEQPATATSDDSRAATPRLNVINNPPPEQQGQLKQLESLGILTLTEVPARAPVPTPNPPQVTEPTAAERVAELHRQHRDAVERSQAHVRELHARGPTATGSTRPAAAGTDGGWVIPATPVTADYPPPSGPLNPSREIAMLKKLAAAIERYRPDHVGFAPNTVGQLYRDGLLKPADFFTPAAPLQLPADFQTRNKIKRGWYLRRFGGIAYLNPIGRKATDPGTVVAFGRTGLGAKDPAERCAAVLWGDGRVSFERSWSKIESILKKQTRKTIRELIADPMPTFPR